MWGKPSQLFSLLLGDRLQCNQLWQRCGESPASCPCCLLGTDGSWWWSYLLFHRGKYPLRRNGSIKKKIDDARVDRHLNRRRRNKKSCTVLMMLVLLLQPIKTEKEEEKKKPQKTEEEKKKREQGGRERKKSFTKISTHDCWCKSLAYWPLQHRATRGKGPQSS